MPYHTPDNAAGEMTSRRFVIPSNHLTLFMGALYELVQTVNFEEVGEMTPDEITQEFEIILSEFVDNERIGVVFSYITTTPPEGSLALDGSTYNDVDYPMLAPNLHPSWDNGDGTFTLPDAQGRAIIGVGSGTGLSTYAMGDTVGLEEVTLTEAQLAAHTHNYDKIAATLTDPGVAPSVIGIDDINAEPTSSTGGDEAHENRQPSLALPLAVWYQ